MFLHIGFGKPICRESFFSTAHTVNYREVAGKASSRAKRYAERR
jgi:hypothetical protein